MTAPQAVSKLLQDRSRYMLRDVPMRSVAGTVFYVLLIDGSLRMGHTMISKLWAASFDAEDITADDWIVVTADQFRKGQ